MGQLRADLSGLKLPLVKAENVYACKKHGPNGLELWWRDQKFDCRLHRTLERVFTRLSTSAIPSWEIASIQLYYLPERRTVLPESWVPRWSIQNPVVSGVFIGDHPITVGPMTDEQDSGPVSPITPQSAFSPTILSAEMTQDITPPGSFYSPAFGPDSPSRSPTSSKPPSVYAQSPSSPASYGSKISLRSTSPLPEELTTLLSLCLSELADPTSRLLEWETRRTTYEEITQPLFDAEPRHRPDFDEDLSQDDFRRALVEALCARVDCASELEMQLQEAIEKNREASINNTRDAVAAETRAHELAGTLAELGSRYDRLSGEYDEFKATLGDRSDQVEALSIQVASLQQDLARSQSSSVAFQTAWNAERTRRLGTESKLATVESTVSSQKTTSSTTTTHSDQLQSKLTRVEKERGMEQEAHTRERERWRAEKAQMLAELDAIRTEKARPFVIPALMEAFLGVNDMVHLATRSVGVEGLSTP